ncbi:MAG: VOC family protein [Thermoplasmata archaeon]|nr:VOC family protein [Thermoplasmata archaeon]
MQPPRLVGFDHLDLWVRDRAAARQFFEKGLGMEVMGVGEEHTFLLFGDVVLGLRDAQPGATSSSQVHHLALRVSQFDGLREQLLLRGLTPVREREREDSRSLYVEGPEGIEVELIHRPEPHHHECDSPRAGR